MMAGGWPRTVPSAGERRRGLREGVHERQPRPTGGRCPVCLWRPVACVALTDGGDDVWSKCDGMLFSDNVAIFRWYFTEQQSFGGIFQIWRSFSAMRPIFPKKIMPFGSNYPPNTICLFYFSMHRWSFKLKFYTMILQIITHVRKIHHNFLSLY